VGARIAKNGTATATSGDLQGLSDAVAVADGTSVAISIADIVP
nr:c-type cytochrome biogenesis protein CcmI [Gammaproteobacteria bacterium]NIR90054.1 c-type cytochrome biogenesis protein CcmI [Gammaproteobacteria bacterium]NIU03258.1 c-type cytochrome biogenesis protein CcmI [Gammaproteobacteria bacterium]NIV50752.1 c-type cytochrome biogenesis protein CcmI [Gammaproteobacteria bacterium]NIV75338.1 c-type cytochrome biogenesis protein CcmI [Gammaproteobacteria bacterium]